MLKKHVLKFYFIFLMLIMASCSGRTENDGYDFPEYGSVGQEYSGSSNKSLEEDVPETSQVTDPDVKESQGLHELPINSENNSDENQKEYQKTNQEDYQENNQENYQEYIANQNLPEYGEYYYDLVNVVLYLDHYDELPPNYITKNEARELGWEGGSVEKYQDGAAIGGDSFGNREGLLPEAGGRSYMECDIDTYGRNSRGSKRLVFSNDGLYFYTSDHYESFSEVTVTEDDEVIW